MGVEFKYGSLDDAALLVAVARDGSFSKASKTLGVSVATVSRNLSRLEASLGVKLVERTTRQLRLTQPGTEMVERCQVGLTEIAAAFERAKEVDPELAGVVRLTTAPNLGPILLPVVASFHDAHPRVICQMMFTQHKLDYLGEDVDVFLRIGELKDDRLVARRIGTYRHVLCASKAFVKKHGPLRTPKDLKNVPCIAFPRGTRDIRWQLEQDGQRRTMKIEPWLMCNDYEVVKQALEEGQGVGELPAVLAASALASGRLVPVLPKWQMQEEVMTLMYAAHRLLPRTVRAFIDHALAHLPTEVERRLKRGKRD